MASSSSDVDAEIQAVLGQLKAEGHIDDQFQQLLLLQDESDPDFVRSVMQLFFEDSQTALARIRDMLAQSPVDYETIDSAVHQLKGSSASFGAHNVTNLCMQLRHAVQAKQQPEAVRLVQQLFDARQVLYERLSRFAELEERKKAQS